MDFDVFDSPMERACELAGEHHPHPNPRVGCVLLDATGVVVGQGAHRGPGERHAEVVALADAGTRAAGATAVVTLEPCSHHGRTPPCTEALIAAGVSRVVVGVTDPDPRVSGRGIQSLLDGGIEVIAFHDPRRVEAVDPGYFHHRRTGRPFVTLKLAMTIDGQVAAADGTSQWITSEEARSDAHRLRSRSDGIVVGGGTVIADDPSLDVRIDGYVGPQPVPVVVMGTRAIPPNARVLAREPLIYRPEGGAEAVDIGTMLDDLGDRGLVDLLVEGGPRLATAFEHLGLVDRYVFYIGGSLAGGVGRSPFEGTFASIGEQRRLDILDVRRLGPDLRITARRSS